MFNIRDVIAIVGKCFYIYLKPKVTRSEDALRIQTSTWGKLIYFWMKHFVTRDVHNISDNLVYLPHGNFSEKDIESFILNFFKQGRREKNRAELWIVIFSYTTKISNYIFSKYAKTVRFFELCTPCKMKILTNQNLH